MKTCPIKSDDDQILMTHTKSLSELVRIVRINDMEELICHIFQSSVDSVIASEFSDSLNLDGFCIIPTKTIRYFDRAFDRMDFYHAALDTWKDMDVQKLPEGFSCVILPDLKLLATKQITVAVHMELDDLDVCFVGTLRDITNKELLLDRISSYGLYIDDPLEINIDDITKVEFSTMYLTAVAHAARLLSKNTD